MKRILVPTDFTRNTESALLYANKMAARMQADIVLLHCCQVPEFNEALRQETLQRLRTLAERLRYQQAVRQGARRIRYDFEVQHGCLQPHLAELMATTPVDLIVMPLEYTDCEPALFPGSHAARIMEMAGCPVLLVPPAPAALNFQNLVFATDVTDQDPAVLQQIGEFAALFKSSLAVAHFYGEEERHHLPEYKKGIQELRQNLPYANLSCHLLEEEDLLEGISDFAARQQAGLLILATQDSFLLQNLFDIRYTKTQAYHTTIPVLAYHQHKLKPCTSCCTACASRIEPQQESSQLQTLV